MSAKNRVALVTGGGRGIGRAIALALAEDGADVAVNFRRDEAAAKDTVAAIEALGRRAAAYQASVDDRQADETMVEAATRDLGPIDILINNAGIASLGNSVADTDPAELERVIRTHALSAHHLSKLLIPNMQKQQRGDIIMISSTATLFMWANGAPYNMAKAAMEALAMTLAKELRPHGIRVNVVSPGLVETEMGRRLMKASQGVDDMRQLDKHMPFGRVCQPEDIANTVRFLVSDKGGYITGEKINVHGGGHR